MSTEAALLEEILTAKRSELGVIKAQMATDLEHLRIGLSGDGTGPVSVRLVIAVGESLLQHQHKAEAIEAIIETLFMLQQVVHDRVFADSSIAEEPKPTVRLVEGEDSFITLWERGKISPAGWKAVREIVSEFVESRRRGPPGASDAFDLVWDDNPTLSEVLRVAKWAVKQQLWTRVEAAELPPETRTLDLSK